MSTSGRKRKQQLKPRQEVQRSPIKRQSLDVKEEPMLANSYPLADYDCVDIKPDLTEIQLQMAMAIAKPKGAAEPEEVRSDLETEQQSDSDEDGYSEINFGTHDIYCEDEVDDYDADWTTQQTTPRLIFKFGTLNQQTGLKSVRKFVCPLLYFNQLLGNRNEFFEKLAKGSNDHNYALGATAEELEVFVGLCLLMSDVKLDQLTDYWSDKQYHGFTGFARKMPLHRFLELLQSLNCNELDGKTPGSGRNAGGDAGKLVNYFNGRMAELYACGQQLVINEPIVHWKGKFNYHNELPERHRHNALMLHLLTEQSGLIIRILPEIVEKHLPRNSRHLVVQRSQLALQLLQDHLHLGHSVYACKYYGSYGLAYQLSRLGTYCSGLLDRNRFGNSKALVHNQLAPNSIATRYAPPLMMAKWRRRQKCVYFYSSDCLAIYAKEMSMQKINARPKLIQQLDFQLRQTQSARQQLLNFLPSCSGIPRQQQLLICLLNMMVFNAHLLYVASAQYTRNYPTSEGKLKTYAEFRGTIIKSLLREDTSVGAVPAKMDSPVTPNSTTGAKAKSKTTPPIRPIPESKLKEPKHQLVPLLHSKKSTATLKNCQYCSKAGMLQFTRLMCNQCTNNPGLCKDPCFELWHAQLKESNEDKLNTSN